MTDEYLHDFTWYAALRRQRLSLDLSLRSASLLSGVSNSYISQLERGQVKSVSFWKLMRLLKLYGLAPGEFAEKYDKGAVR